MQTPKEYSCAILGVVAPIAGGGVAWMENFSRLLGLISALIGILVGLTVLIYQIRKIIYQRKEFKYRANYPMSRPVSPTEEDDD